MLVVDTNVVASLSLSGAFSEQGACTVRSRPRLAQRSVSDDRAGERPGLMRNIAPKSLICEEADVFPVPTPAAARGLGCSQVKLRDMPLPVALDLLTRADAVLADGLVQIPHEAALTLAAQRGVSAGDARCLAGAQRLQTRQVTEDAKLRGKAPDLTCSLAEALRR